MFIFQGVIFHHQHSNIPTSNRCGFVEVLPISLVSLLVVATNDEVFSQTWIWTIKEHITIKEILALEIAKPTLAYIPYQNLRSSFPPPKKKYKIFRHTTQLDSKKSPFFFGGYFAPQLHIQPGWQKHLENAHQRGEKPSKTNEFVP